VVSSGDARYLLGSLQVRVGVQTNNRAMLVQGMDAILSSGGASDAETNLLLKNQAALFHSTGDSRKAESALTRLLERNPNDLDALVALAEIRAERKRVPEALTMLDRAIELRRAAGQPVPESWYKFQVRCAFDTRATAQALKTTKQWIATYPSAENWRDALENLRALMPPDRETDVDIWRVMRATRSLAGERDYFTMSDLLKQAGYAAEAKSVVDEAASARIIDASKPATAQRRKGTTPGKGAAPATPSKTSLAASEKTALAAPTGADALKVADGYFGNGDYAKASELYRAALQKGSVDPNLVNTRLGLALALAGRGAEAQPVLQTVAGGARGELASLMLIWLAQRC
jgi:tetratricopeptide (TPR) repeat protein